MWHLYNCEEFFYASRFMSLLAQHILSQHERSLKKALKAIIGASGIGFCFEYLGHKEMLRCGHRFEETVASYGIVLNWGFKSSVVQKIFQLWRPEAMVFLIDPISISSMQLYNKPDTLINFSIAKFHKPMSKWRICVHVSWRKTGRSTSSFGW